MSNINNHIMELEIKNSHLEDTIEQLNQIVIQQQQSIDEIVRHLEQIQNKISNLQESHDNELAEPPPPHY